MTGVATEDTLFGEQVYIEEDLEVAEGLEVEERLAAKERLVVVAIGKFGDGTVSFFGDVNAQETTCTIMAVIAHGPRM